MKEKYYILGAFNKLSDACLPLRAFNHEVIQLACKLAHIHHSFRKALQAYELASVSPAPIHQKTTFQRYIY